MGGGRGWGSGVVRQGVVRLVCYGLLWCRGGEVWSGEVLWCGGGSAALSSFSP
jgi:hypothetical protein